MMRRGFYSLLLIILIVGCPFLAEAAKPYNEYQLKAAIIFNIAKFVTWPDGTFADSAAPLRIAVLGNGEEASGFASLEGKKIGSRPVEVNFLESISDFRYEQILYIANSEEISLEEVSSACSDRPVLTIGGSETFAKKGGIINLVKVGANIRFAINLDASVKANLQLSSKLHALATEVIRNRD